MNTPTIFNYQGSELRTVTREGTDSVWFVAADVAKILGHRDAAQVARMLEASEQGYASVDTPGGKQRMLIINESGLYAAAFRSRVEGAVSFRLWVTEEVIPSIRKTGSYGAPALTGPELMAAALIEAQATLAAKDAEIRTLAPKASRYETFLGADGDYSMRDAAQVLSRDHSIKVGQNRLAALLREIRWIDKRGIPYQDRIDAGHLRAKPRTRIHQRTGERIACDPQVRVTMRGLDLLAERLGGRKLVEVRTP